MKRLMWALCPMWMLVACVLPDEQTFLEDRTKACGRDFTCPGSLVCLDGFCVPAELDAAQCVPACAPYEACTARRTCAPRYSALALTPNDGAVVNGAPLDVKAELRVATGFASNFPETLRFSVMRSDGGVGGTLAQVVRTEGSYGTRWTPPGEGDFMLTAAHPADGGPRGSVLLKVDTTPPTFSVFTRPHAVEPSDAGTLYADPALPNAWRRDQVATIDVRSNDPNLDPNTVVLRVRTAGGTTTPGEPVSFVTGVDCGARFCGTVQVKLWEPPFDAFRGALTLDVLGRDRAGNSGISSGSVNVTRWKWRYDISSSFVTAAPAVGNTGTVYVGTTNGDNTDGRLFALTPNGRLLWDSNLGAVVSSPTVGKRNAAGIERVYAAHKKGSVNRVGFYAGNGNFVSPCYDVDSTTALVQSSLALADITLGGTTTETVYGVYTGSYNGSLFAIRPDAAESSLRCPVGVGVGDVFAPGTMLATGNSVVMASSAGRLKSYALRPIGSWSSSPQWEWPFNTINPTSLAVANGRIFFGSNDGSASKLGTASLDGGAAPTTIPTSSQVWNISIGGPTASQASVGLNRNALLVLDAADGGTRSIETPSEIIKGAPVWGAGGHVYTASSTTGSIQARRPLETVAWQFDTDFPIEASMNLDCNRQLDGGIATGIPTGVLYAASQDGKVFAVIVDSPGLDPNAPWPRYQHDTRNTGNPDTPIVRCQ